MSTVADSPYPEAAADFRPLALAPRAVALQRRTDGTLLLQSTQPLGPRPTNICSYLRHWAESDPQRPFLWQRVGPWRPGVERPWRSETYGAFYLKARAIAQALLDRGLAPERPVIILSANSIEHALLSVAGMMVGVPTAAVSPAYSLLSADLGKIRYLADLLTPGLVFAQDAPAFGRALSLLSSLDSAPELVVQTPTAGITATPFESLLDSEAGPAVEAAWDAVRPETFAKILLTSGSTGTPKAVPNTHGMLTANQAMLAWAMPPDPARPPRVLDWLPWNHTFGANLVLLTVMREGGELWIDEGRPLPGRIEESLENLRCLSPTQLYNVPTGFVLLAAELERNPAFREVFFRDLRFLFYGGSGLPKSVWDTIQSLAQRTIGKKIVFMNGFGATETGPMAALQHWPVEGPGCVGLPLPGVTAKLVPHGERYEIRFKGPMLFPGYLKQPDKTAAAFDEEGFFRIGDAGRLADPERPEEGIRPDGRLVEDFKLMTGTFVSVGRTRLALLSALPLLQDAVIAGPDRPFVTVLAWPNLPACRKLTGRETGTAEELLADPQLRAEILAGLARFNAGQTGVSGRIARLLLLADPPDPDADEITDKGYVNQRRVLERRRREVERLYADPPGPSLICP